MAGPSVQAGEVIIPARIDLNQAAEDLKVTLPRLAKEGAGKTGKELLAALKQGFDLRKGIAQEQLARGLIDKDQFKRAINDLKKEFNSALLPELKRLRTEGKEGTEEYQKLARSLKSVASEGRRAANEADKIPSAAQRAVSAFTAVKGVVTGFVAFLAARGAFRFFDSAIETAKEAASIWDVLGANVDNAGVAFAKVRPEIEAAASAAQRATRFDDESFAGALSELISITHDYTGSLRNMDVVLDLAAAKHMDLDAAATLVGKAMIGQTDTFARMGIKIREGSDAIEQLRKQFRGAAETEGRGLVGTLARVRNAWDDVKQAVGEAILQNDAASGGMEGLVGSLVKLEAWIRKNAYAFEFFVQKAADALGAAGRFAAWIARKADPAGFLASEEIADIQQSPDIMGHADVLARRLGTAKARRDLHQERLDALKPEQLRSQLQAAREAGTAGIGLAAALKPDIEKAEQLETQIKADTQVIRFLEAELAKLAAAPATPPKPKVIPDDEEIKRARGLLKDWHEEQMSELEQRLAKLKEVEKAAVLAGTPADVAKVRAQRQEVERTIDTVNRLFTGADELVPELGRSFEELGPHLVKGLDPVLKLQPFLRELAPQLKAIVPTVSSLVDPMVADFETKMAEIKEAQRRGFITPAEAKKRGEEAAKAFNAGLLSILDTLRKTGKLSDAAYKEIISHLQDTGEAADQAGQSLETLAAKAQLFENLARSVLSVADAIGGIDDNARRSLQSVVDLASGVAQIAGSGGNPLAILSGGTQVLAGLFGIVNALGGDKERVAEEQRQLVLRLVDLQRAVEDNTKALRNQKAAGETTTGIANTADIWNQLINGHNPKGVQGNAQDLLKNPEMVAQLRQIEEATGVQLVDLLETFAKSGKQGDFNAFFDAWMSAQHILHEAAAEFGKIADSDVAAQMSRFRQEIELLDLDTPTEQLEAFIAVLKRIGAGKFADQLQGFIDQKDFAGARKLIQDVYEQLVSGGFTAEQAQALFGPDVTAEDIKQILLDANGYLEEITKNGEGGGQTTAFQVSQTITARQADLFITLLTTLIYWAERGVAAQEATASAVTSGEYSPPAGSVAAGGNTPAPVVADFTELLDLETRQADALDVIVALMRAAAAGPTPDMMTAAAATLPAGGSAAYANAGTVEPPSPAALEGGGNVYVSVQQHYDALIGQVIVGEGGFTPADREQLVGAAKAGGRAAGEQADAELGGRLRTRRRFRGRN